MITTSLQSIGGMNDGLRNSSSEFMKIIHGIQDFQGWISGGFYDLMEGISILQGLF